MLDRVESICRSYMNQLEGKFYKLDGISKEDEELIKDYAFVKKEDAYYDLSKLQNDWPSGRGIFISNSKNYIIKVNNIDHLEISYVINDVGIMESINQLNEALSHIENTMKFAHDYKLGYVTPIPSLINDFTISIKLRVHEKMEAD
jgi:protein-arginine kinase